MLLRQKDRNGKIRMVKTSILKPSRTDTNQNQDERPCGAKGTCNVRTRAARHFSLHAVIAIASCLELYSAPTGTLNAQHTRYRHFGEEGAQRFDTFCDFSVCPNLFAQSYQYHAPLWSCPCLIIPAVPLYSSKFERL